MEGVVFSHGYRRACRLERRRFMRRAFKFSLGVVVLFAAFSVVLLMATIYTYDRLTGETLIAELRFDATSDRQYVAHLRTGDRCEDRTFPLYGDQWRIDAEFLKWKYWALLLGLDSQYRLDRLEGRYRSVADQNSQRNVAHALSERTAVDVVDARRVARLVEFPARRDVRQLDLPGYRRRRRLLRLPHDHGNHHAARAAARGARGRRSRSTSRSTARAATRQCGSASPSGPTTASSRRSISSSDNHLQRTRPMNISMRSLAVLAARRGLRFRRRPFRRRR